MPFYIVVILISCFASILCVSVKENRLPPLTFFPFFLLLTALIEYYGWRQSLKNHNTILLYNFFSLFEFIFYLLFFTYLFNKPVIKKIILLVTALYFAITIINIFLLQGINTFHTYTYILGCILIVVFSIVYFYLLFRFPETGKLTKNPFFWIVTGLMFFHTCSFSYMGLQNFITETMKQYNWELFFVQDILNVLLYTLFSIGFLCKINFRKL
jgi:hypothetical protein